MRVDLQKLEQFSIFPGQVCMNGKECFFDSTGNGLKFNEEKLCILHAYR